MDDAEKLRLFDWLMTQMSSRCYQKDWRLPMNLLIGIKANSPQEAVREAYGRWAHWQTLPSRNRELNPRVRKTDAEGNER